MYGLTSSLSTASEALNAAGGAIAITNNNIANANTAGYSRQVVSLSASALQNSGSVGDNGVSFNGYSTVRNNVLALNINQKTSEAASFGAQSTLLSQVESAFSSTDAGVGSALTSFFSNVSALSTSPSDPATRQAALSSAGAVASAFNQASASLAQASSDADKTIAGAVQQINQLASQIASLNAQLQPSVESSQDGGNLQSQRDALTTQLAQLVGLTSVTTEANPSLGLSSGSPLVIGSSAYSLQLQQASDGSTHIIDTQGKDVTASISGGTLGGALSTRQVQLPALKNALNQFATEFADAINTAQAAGYDATGNQGQALFTIGPSSQGAAAGIQLNLSSAAGLATSGDGSANSSGNVSQLLSVSTQPLASGGTPAQRYAGLVQQIGTLSAQASSGQTATEASLNQLTSMQSSQSGVSIDEETTNLLRYQQAYSAAAQVISTLNNLFSAVLGMSGAN